MPAIQTIFREHFETVKGETNLPLRMLKAATAIIFCRTAAMGGRVERCPEGHVERICYNSCRHRSCPTCGHLPRERWLEKQQARLLACDHHHIIFTIPPALYALWQYNRELMMDLLFHCVRDTLFTLLADKRYGGFVPGLLCSLHTWGRDLCFHPHLHCLITAGGLCDRNAWAWAKKAGLLPYFVVRELYRGKMIAAIRDALRSGELVLPPSMPAFRLENTLNRLGRESWNVEVGKRYSHGNGVLVYLARYVRGGPISNSRIISSDASSVTFAYLDHRDGNTKEMRLSPRAFILRVLQHVPPERKKTVRYYGLYAEHNLKILNASRAALGQEPAEPAEYLTWEALYDKIEKELPNLCPVCKRRLVLGRYVSRWDTYHPEKAA